MIVDSHAHIFQDWAGACGHPSRETHRRFIQKVLTRPAAKVFRARDGEEVTRAALFREGDNSWAGLTDVNLRVGVYGQLDFTLDGEDYYVQYMPVGMHHIVAPPELMLAQMTYARVDHCVLQAGGGYGAMNDYNAFAQQQYPGQFTGLLNVDEPRADTDAVLAELDRAHHRLGLRGVYYGLDTFARYGFDVEFNDRRFDAFWSTLDRWRPYIEAQALIRDARDTFGASKLIWGSDMPNVERFCTYTQCVDYVRRHCNFLTAHEKDQVLGGNLDRILGLSERSRAGVAG